jgi:ABC-type transporter Mla MlaB component
MLAYFLQETFKKRHAMTAALNLSAMPIWAVPAALNHKTWQAAKTQCVCMIDAHLAALPKTVISPKMILNWSQCTLIDSSALAFVLALKRQFPTLTIAHRDVSLQLNQLAQLYEVDDIIGFKLS